MKNKKSFNCQGEKCTNSCCGAFEGFSDRLLSVDGRSFIDIILTDRDVIKLRGSSFEKYMFIGKDGIYRIKTSEQGVCSAYTSGKCAMNNLKPTICKCFPLYLDAFVGLCVLKDCPAVEESYKIENYSNEIGSMIELYEFWISHYKSMIDGK